MPEPELDFVPMPAGHMETTTWGQVGIGHVVRDQKDRLHTVVDEAAGWLKLVAAKTGEVAELRRPPADKAVDIYVPSDRELENLLDQRFGAELLRDIESREHTITRSLTWRMGPIANTVAALHNHLDMAHQLPVNDVAGRYASGVEQLKGIDPEKKKEGSAKKKASLAELRQAHDEAHADPNAWPQAIVHYHAKE